MTLKAFDEKLYEVYSSHKMKDIDGVYDSTSIYYVISGDKGSERHLVRFSGECIFSVDQIDSVIKTLQEIKRKV